MDRIEKLKELLTSSKDDSFLQHALALEYIKIGNDPEAKKLFTALLEREPGYVGSYYHLGKLYERNGNIDEAMNVYEKGMSVAQSAGDKHSYNELQGVYEELSD